MDSEPDLYLLGSGIYGFSDITLYTQSILQTCKTAFYLQDSPSLRRYLEKMTANPVNLLPLYYIEGRDRLEIYEDIVAHVIDAAVKQRPTALLLHGNPIVCSTISQRLLEAAKNRSLSTEVVPAVSCLDRIFVDLRLDIAERGLQIFEASNAVAGSIPLLDSVDLLMLQIGALNNPCATRTDHTPREEVLRLKDYLGNYYLPDHVMYVVTAAYEVGVDTLITRTCLADLEHVAEAMTYTASLFIPARGAVILPDDT